MPTDAQEGGGGGDVVVDAYLEAELEAEMRAALDTDLPEFDSAAAGDDAAGGDGILFVNEGVEVDAPAAAAAAAARPRPSSAGKPLGTAAPAKGGGYKAFRLPQNGGALSAEALSCSSLLSSSQLTASIEALSSSLTKESLSLIHI